MDDTGGLGRFGALANRPGPDLWIACREEGDEVQQSIRRVDEGRERRLFQARVFEKHPGLLVRQFADLGLEPGGEGDHLGMLGGSFLTEGLQLGGLLTDLVLPDVGDVQHRLGGEEGEAFEKFRLLNLEAHGSNRFALVEVSRQPVEELQLLLLLGARLETRGPGDLLPALVHHIEVR